MTLWIGRIEPSMWFEGPWWEEVLPDDVRLAVLSLGVRRLRDEDLEIAHAQILDKVSALDDEGVDVINVGGSPVVTLYGREGHARLLREIGERTTRPYVTSLQAEVEALQAVGGTKVLIASPYPIKQTERRVTVLEDEGFEIAGHNSLDIERNRDITSIDPQQILDQAETLVREHPDGNVLYFPCGSLPAPLIIDELERRTGLPAITNVQAQAWASLKRAGYDRPVEGFGRLLRDLGAQPVA
jgi:maleate isomerase